MRDELEIYLLEKGYRNDTFNLASHTLSENLNTSAKVLNGALNETIDTITNKEIEQFNQTDIQKYN